MLTCTCTLILSRRASRTMCLAACSPPSHLPHPTVHITYPRPVPLIFNRVMERRAPFNPTPVAEVRSVPSQCPQFPRSPRRLARRHTFLSPTSRSRQRTPRPSRLNPPRRISASRKHTLCTLACTWEYQRHHPGCLARHLRTAVKGDEYEILSKSREEETFREFERRVGTDSA